MKRQRRLFEIDLIPSGKERPRRFYFSVRKVWGALLLFLVAATGWLLLFRTTPALIDLWNDPAVKVFERENRILQATYDKLSIQSTAVTRQLEQIRTQQQRIFGLADLENSTEQQPAAVLPKSGTEAVEKAEKLSLLSRQTAELFFSDVDRIKKLPFVPPFKEKRLVSIQFGTRLDPFTGKRLVHEGLDFLGSIGDTIVAPADGIVSFPSLHRGFGSTLRLTHQNGVTTTYAHLERALVSRDQRVSQGKPIALMGNSGRSSAPHLHYEVRRNGLPVDPKLLFLDAHTISNDRSTGGAR